MDLSNQPTTRYLTAEREIDVVQPDSFEPRLSEIFTALPKINRYNGQTTRPYSVALHSYMCHKVAMTDYRIREPHKLLAVLMHDASEAYVGDIVRPIKYTMMAPQMAQVELEIMTRILTNVMNYTEEEMDDINEVCFLHDLKEIDSRMAVTEIEQLRSLRAPVAKLNGYTAFDVELPKFDFWHQDEYLFRQTYFHLQTERLKLTLRKEDDGND